MTIIKMQHVLEAYAQAENGVLDNETLYQQLAHDQQIEADAFARTEPIGKGRVSHSPLKRKVRWFQQSLKMLGILERVPDQRGVWALSEKAGKSLHKATAGVQLLAFSTQLGLAVWGSNREVLANWQDPIALCITSPPYPLRIPRDYGNPSQAQYVDFLCETLEPIVRSLLPGASIVLNIPNDIFEPNSPSRSLIPERLVLALHDRLGLSLMDRIPWVNYSKPPAPTYWACVQRYQLNSAYEMLYWFTNDPLQVRSDNRRVLQEHSRKHAELLAGGGEQRAAVYGDGAFQVPLPKGRGLCASPRWATHHEYPALNTRYPGFPGFVHGFQLLVTKHLASNGYPFPKRVLLQKPLPNENIPPVHK